MSDARLEAPQHSNKPARMIRRQGCFSRLQPLTDPSKTKAGDDDVDLWRWVVRIGRRDSGAASEHGTREAPAIDQGACHIHIHIEHVD